MYKCSNPDCHSDRFYRTEYGSCNYTCTEIINSADEFIDADNYDYSDFESTDYDDDIKCYDCDRYAIYYDEDAEPEPKNGWKVS